MDALDTFFRIFLSVVTFVVLFSVFGCTLSVPTAPMNSIILECKSCGEKPEQKPCQVSAPKLIEQAPLPAKAGHNLAIPGQNGSRRNRSRNRI